MKFKPALDHTITEYNRISRNDKLAWDRAIKDMSIDDYLAWVKAGRPGMEDYRAAVVRAFVLNRRHHT